ncbi:hypothetical protein GWG54_18860 [Natronococcus sp. JC468]|uniref:hypothetical protein n=1 Tax=Natronococcus sp. JC468 TaxID=1961921 RepID=UPI00143C9D20|nr:hypothetical protein [Natronococcus sp. JC468]NKE37822.1 hypothetical protein [Natronococcus sp. JC468]
MSTHDERCNDPTIFEDWSRPADRLWAELHCLARTIIPSKATGTRGAVTIFLFFVWTIMILGVEVDHAIITLQYGAGQYIQHLLTALAFW